MDPTLRALLLDALRAVQSEFKEDSPAAGLVHSVVSGVEAAFAQGRGLLDNELRTMRQQIDNVTGGNSADLVSTATMPAGASGEAVDRGDGTGTPTAKPEDVTGSASNPDPAGVGPGPMFDEAHGLPGSTNVGTSRGTTVNTMGYATPTLSADDQKALDDHARAAPSEEASQVNPVNPATGVAAGMQPVTEANSAAAAIIPDASQPEKTHEALMAVEGGEHTPAGALKAADGGNSGGPFGSSSRPSSPPPPPSRPTQEDDGA